MSYFMTVAEVSKELGVSRSSAYKIIRELNEELMAQGYMVITGKVIKEYLDERFHLKKAQ